MLPHITAFVPHPARRAAPKRAKAAPGPAASPTPATARSPCLSPNVTPALETCDCNP